MTIKLITNPDPAFIKKWIEFDTEFNTYNIFQTPQLFGLFRQTKGYTTYLMADIDGDGKIYSTFIFYQIRKKGIIEALIKRVASVGLPVAVSIEAKEKMLEHMTTALGKPYNIMKIVLTEEVEALTRSARELKWEKEPHLNYIIGLDISEQDLWNNISETRRKQIKRAAKRGLSVRILDHLDNVQEIYEIMKHTRVRTKLEAEDIDIFVNSNRILSPSHHIKYFLAYAEEKLVAFRIELIYKNYIYDWYAGNLTEYQSYYPNDFLVWEVLKWGNNNGYKKFDFGGAGKPDKAYGVREFKKRFGGKLIEHGYWVDTDRLFKLLYQFIKS